MDVVLSLLKLVSVAASSDRDWEHLMEGDDKETSKSTGIQKVVITATCLIPKLSESSSSATDKCLSERTQVLKIRSN